MGEIRTVRVMERMTANWIRIGVVALLGLPNVAIGAWAIVDPSGWFATFPGVGPALVAGDPPFNQHLASDVGAAFFATGAGLLVAAHWGTRRVIQLALLTFLAFTAPHVTYHALHPSPGLSGAADVLNVLLLGSGALWALGLLWAASTDRFSANNPLSDVTGEAPATRPEEVPV